MKKFIILTMLFIITTVGLFAQSEPSKAEAVRTAVRVDSMLDDRSAFMEEFLLDGSNLAKFRDYVERLRQINFQANHWYLLFFNRRADDPTRQECLDNHKSESTKYKALKKEMEDWLASLT